ncbi:PIN domain-like protein [Thelephora ganbajun]|uniref:PIN domain-like protein n=1 Tax=Thelephora ganbajun TaxID=370292 RepID=A0ACB6ZVD4_THEGA|nr:PIN domain-like protein [Thelephora ganbajun]
MGVLGLVPFLRKKSPHVLKSVPSRFKELQGKVVVFDATLITQRFHFAPTPHEYRHILGWYRLIQELHENNVRAICVFDGKERNAAKQREATRRREQRRMTYARGAIETERLSRLTRLRPLITSYESLPEREKVEVASSLQNVTKDFPVDQHRTDEMTFEPEANRPNAQSTPNVPPQFIARDDSVDPVLDGVTSDLGSLNIASKTANSESPPTQTMADQVEGSLTHDSSRVSSMLAALYSSFLASVQKMGVLLSPRTVLPRPEEQDDETKVTQELSQAQRRLVMKEEWMWKRLSEVTSEEGTEGDVSSLARELEDKSARILTSYERRNNPPTSEVYNQCRIILQAMGVPCTNAKGGVEGEALAAAIVRDGLADFVASEDTDVLVYGVPLLRNVTSGTEPLTLIEGHEVRDALDMDSSQFLDFALLLGTDFTDRIRNVGPIRALKFILCYGSIEKIIEGEPKYAPKITTADYLEQIRVARAVFQFRPTVPAPERLKVRQPNDSLVLKVLQRFKLQRFAEKDADFSSLLGINYFSDQP